MNEQKDSTVMDKLQEKYKGFDFYGCVSEKHNLTRDVVKKATCKIFYSSDYDAETKQDVIEVIEKHLAGLKLIKLKLRIFKHTNKKDLKLLKETSVKVTEFNQELKELAEDMFKIMPVHAVALAAVQVGVPIRMFVWADDMIQCPDKIIVNPEILESTGRMKYEERCLSFPDLVVKTKRKSFTRMKYQDINGNEKEYQVSGEESICIQHEVDHMNGILMSDHGSLYKDS